MSTDQYDKYCEAYLGCEKLRRDLRELHKQKELLRNDASNTRESKIQEIQSIAGKEQETEIELRKVETVLKTEENALNEHMIKAKDSSFAVEHDYGGTGFVIAFTKIADGKGYLNINKRS